MSSYLFNDSRFNNLKESEDIEAKAIKEHVLLDVAISVVLFCFGICKLLLQFPLRLFSWTFASWQICID